MNGRTLPPAQRRVLATLLSLGGTWTRGCSIAFPGSRPALAALEDKGLIIVTHGHVEIGGVRLATETAITITSEGRSAFPLVA